MHNKRKTISKCEKCNVRIPKNRPLLKCSICDTIKHFKCNGLSKKEAYEIIIRSPHWACLDCISSILPINAATEPIRARLDKCTSCNKTINPSSVISTCGWCDNRCHKSCINGGLGCKKCCNLIIPGFNHYAHEIIGESYLKNKPIFNPWNQEHLINQLGLRRDALEEQTMWSDLSSKLSNCKYSTMKNLPSNRSKSPSILSLNIRSLFKGIDKLRGLVSILQEKCDIICLCETNLKLENLPKGLENISLDGFHEPILQDPHRNSGKGGGLVIYVNENFCNSDEIDPLDMKDIIDPANEVVSNPPGEFLFIKIGPKQNNENTIISGNKKHLIIGNIYRSPSSNNCKFIERLDCHLKKLDRHKNKTIHLVGDFNVDLAKYDKDFHCHDLINKMAEYNFAQLISLPTRITDHTATIIDHVYTNQVHTQIKSFVITLDISDHLGTYVQFKTDLDYPQDDATGLPESLSKFINFRKFNAANMDKFKGLIEHETWEAVDNVTSADEKYEKFIEIYDKHYNETFELQSARRKNQRKNPKPWILPWLEDACARKNDAFYTKTVTPTPENIAQYNKLKAFTDKHVDKAKKKFYHDFFEKYQTDSKRQWSTINLLLNRNKKRNRITKIRDCDGNVATAPQTIADKFNDYFANIAGKLKEKLPQGSSNVEKYLSNGVSSSIYLEPTSDAEVSLIIENFKVKATSDLNIETIKVVNKSSPQFSRVIASVINSSLLEGVFPSALKTAKVVPIYKGGSKFDIQNYRPISLLSAFSKIYEKVMYRRIYEFLTLNNILHENQYGFRQGRSCEHALLVAQNAILSSLNKKQVSLLLLIDFSKAFDMVDHRILLDKLYHYGIRGIAHSWLSSYLSGRKQYVALNNKISATLDMQYGVPQGSILGPLLFIIYINDIPNVSKIAKFVMYADDANVLLTGKTVVDIERKFNELSKHLETWVNSNGLAFNLKKTHYMIFSKKKICDLSFTPKICNYEISKKSNARFLGVIMNDSLTWVDHIIAVKAKMSRYVGILYKLKKFLPLSARKNIFNSFVQSHLNYCSLVWGLGCKSSIEKLFTEQKKAIRALAPGFNRNFYKDGIKPCHTKRFFAENGVLTVHSVILTNILLFMFKYYNYNQYLPSSVSNIISPAAPKPDIIINNDHIDWLSDHTTGRLRNAISFKGPLFSTHYMNEIIQSCADSVTSLIPSLNAFKRRTKIFLFEQQTQGIEDEWEGKNTPLFYVPGLPRGSRNNTGNVTYTEF